MEAPALSLSPRLRGTPYTRRVEAAGARAYSVYNHMLIPTVFRGLEADYRHLKQHVQLWDVSCERQVELSGPDALSLAQRMTPRDLSRAVKGQCLYVPLVDPEGALLNDPVLLKLSEQRVWLSLADADVLLWAKGLAHGLGLDVRIHEPEVYPLAVQGPKAEALMSRVFGEAVRGIRFFRFQRLDFQGHPLIVARSGWSHQGGFEIYLDDPGLGEALWDALWQAGESLQVGPGCPNLIERIEAGLLSYGNDMTRDHNPLECALERYCQLDRPLNCLGMPALRRIAREGVRRRIRGLRIQCRRLTPCRQVWPVYLADRPVGRVASAAFSPDLDCGVAIAMLDRDAWAVGQTVAVDTPEGAMSAEVVDLPFGRR